MTSVYDAYYNAPQPIRDFVDSGRVGELIEKVVGEGPYTPLRAKIILSATSYCLSADTYDDLTTNLKTLGVDDTTVIQIADGVKNLLNESIHDISQSLEIDMAEQAALEQSLSSLTNTLSPTEPTYTSTQSAILHEGDDAPGQWGTR